MNWTSFITYGDSYQEAFETLCNQLFERYLRRTYKDGLVKFRVINGAGGDGGIEAYGELKNGDLIAIQAKWFRQVIDDSEIKQIRKSVTTAMSLRNNIKEYIICVPRDLNSVKFGRGAKGAGKKPVLNTEEKTVDDFTDEIESRYSTLNISWWFEQDLEFQLQEADNDGVHKFWFEKELISFKHLVNQFDLQKDDWLHSRYIPELHGHGIIQKGVQQLLYHVAFRDALHSRLQMGTSSFTTAERLIGKFAGTLKDGDPLKKELLDIEKWLTADLKIITETGKSIHAGDNEFGLTSFRQVPIERKTLDALSDIEASNTQIGLQERLVESLNRVNSIQLSSFMSEIQLDAQQNGKLFVGDSGTGKTHGLSNTVETQLGILAPAIIIRAKGTLCTDWTVILSKALELTGWDKNQILSALETLAIRNDHRLVSHLKPGDEGQETTKVVLCIDGLEEDTAHWADWYGRMRQSVRLMEQYPLVRFIFTARNYFLDEKELPKSSTFQVVKLPREGDVAVLDVMDRYFSKEHYNITIELKSLIRGLDSLFALRLFCDEYKGKTLTAADDIVTAEKVLLNKKVDRMNKEFTTLFNPTGTAVRTPVRDALKIIAECFYTATSVEHNELFDLLKPAVEKYLTDAQLDQLIEYLATNGLLIKNEVPAGSEMLGETKFTYQLPYQSIMELVMGDKFAASIIGGELTRIPEFLLEVPDYEETEEINEQEETTIFVNKRIVQNIASTLFYEHDKLIGSDGFLTEGLDGRQIADLQMEALIKAPSDLAAGYRESIEDIFFENYKRRHFMFRDLIYPASNSSANYFGAEFLHKLLLEQPSAFAREKIWLGWDRYSIGELGEKENAKFYRYNLQSVIDLNGDTLLSLPPFALHNELPLVYSWALATLDQEFRHKLRVALTGWGIQQPMEFVSLLQKLFAGNDPQILEDLASITLGLASKLEDKKAIENLAHWALNNVFADTEKHRNVIVREGFRAIVERAYQYELITQEQVENARPKVLTQIKLLPLDQLVLDDPHEEIYPIVHDLAWYVIERSFNDFLDYGDDDENQDSNANRILTINTGDNETEKLTPHVWAMAAAISYMKSLGFNRTKGNGSTQATHGSKSDVFTLEEKYTWLAVHYIQAYLSDYLPLKDREEYLEDYTEIVDIPNPAEFLANVDAGNKYGLLKEWVIQEHLIPELEDVSDFEEAIRVSVQSEPKIKLENWIRFNETDFINASTDQKFLALFNYTSLHDSRDYVSARIDVRASIIEKGQAETVKDLLLHHPRRRSFGEDVDRMHANPKTDVYSNPSDVVWMNWIGETEFLDTYYPNATDQHDIFYTVTSVTNNTVNGETEVKIPSKIVRELLGIVEMDWQTFLDKDGTITALMQTLKKENNDRQDMILVKEKEFLEQLDKSGFEVVWFAELLSSKNPLNDAIKSDIHPMKCRKYFVNIENGTMQTTKYWDARFSNKLKPNE